MRVESRATTEHAGEGGVQLSVSEAKQQPQVTNYAAGLGRSQAGNAAIDRNIDLASSY